MTYCVTKTEICLNCQGKGHIIIPDDNSNGVDCGSACRDRHSLLSGKGKGAPQEMSQAIAQDG